MILEGQDVSGVKALDSFDADVFNYKFSCDVSSDIELMEVTPNSSHEASEEELQQLIDSILESPRYKDDMYYHQRMESELEFFIRTTNVVFLIKCKELVDKLKENNEVWGVGRGSSCASLLLYLLGVTDIDPVKYDIPFSELSKEIESSKWE